MTPVARTTATTRRSHGVTPDAPLKLVGALGRRDRVLIPGCLAIRRCSRGPTWCISPMQFRLELGASHNLDAVDRTRGCATERDSDCALNNVVRLRAPAARSGVHGA